MKGQGPPLASSVVTLKSVTLGSLRTNKIMTGHTTEQDQPANYPLIMGDAGAHIKA